MMRRGRATVLACRGAAVGNNDVLPPHGYDGRCRGSVKMMAGVVKVVEKVVDAVAD